MSKTVLAPANFVAQHALAYGAPGEVATSVDAAHPLPVASALGAASSAALAGSASASGAIGPFAPQLGRPVWLTLSGTWSGSVRLLRSVDGGATRLPLSYPDGSARGQFTGNVQLPVAEETVAAATYYLDATIASGTLAYRVEQ